MTMLTIDISLIRMLSDGPDVSLNGSPTVSPTMVALWHSEPFPPKFPSSTIFFALSHAPPEMAMKIYRMKPVDRPPTRSNKTPPTPRTTPMITGMIIARRLGSIISCWAERVLISTQRP